MSELDRRIRERAYRLWLEEGRPEGRSEEHWHRAAEQVAAEDGQPPPAKAEPRATRAKRQDGKLDERDRDGVSRRKPVRTAADDAVARDKPARAGRKASKLIDPGR